MINKENQFLFILVTLPPLPALPDTPQKTYVDPLIYVDVVDAVKEFVNEIDPASLSLESLIGAGINSVVKFCLLNKQFEKILNILTLTFNFSGEFAHVYQGKLTLQDGKNILVAAKTLKVCLRHTICLIILFSLWGTLNCPPYARAFMNLYNFNKTNIC